MKKLLFVTNYLCQGGVEKALINLVNSLDKNKYIIDILCIVKKKELANQVNSKVKIRYIFSDKIKGVDLLFKYIPTNILYKLFVREKYDIEIAYSDGKATKLIGGSSNSKAIKYAWIHQDLAKYDKLLNCYKTWNEYYKSYSAFRKVFCVSKGCKRSYESIVKCQNAEVLYNIVPNSIKDDAKEPAHITDNRLKLITVGRLSVEKGQLRLLKILNKIRKSGYDFLYIIVGDGVQKIEIEEYIKKNNLENNILMIGFTANPYKYMTVSDVYICPSYTEALSTTCIESLLLNIPVISTDVPGAREIVEKKYGAIIDNSDDELYKILEKIFKNSDIVNDWKKNKKQIDKFDESSILKRLDEHWLS